MTKSAGKHSGGTRSAGQRFKKHMRNLGLGVLPMQALGLGAGATGKKQLYGLSLGTLGSLYTGNQAYTEAVRDTGLPVRTLVSLAGSAPLVVQGVRDRDEDGKVMAGLGGILAGVGGDVRDYARNYGDWSEQRRRRRRVIFGRKPARKVRSSRARKGKGKGKGKACKT